MSPSSADRESTRFRIAVLAPLLPRKAYATTGAPPLRAFAADSAGIDGLLAQIPVGLKLEVADPLGKVGEKIRVDLEIPDLKGFRPDVIAERVAPLRALAAARQSIKALAQRGADRAESVAELSRILPVAAWAEALAPASGGTPARPSAPARSSSSIDALLDQVDLGGGSEAPAAPSAPPPGKSGKLGSLIAEIARGGTPSRPSSAGGAVERAGRAHGALLGEILDHPEFRRLERAWRSARYLLSVAKAPVEVEFVPLDDANLAEALVYLVERPAEIVGAPDLLVLDTEIPLTPPSLAALEIPAQAAERLRAPLIVATRSDELLETDDTTQALRAAGEADWAAWVVIACNGGLLRGPYTPESSRLKDPPFRQEGGAAGARCFASPAYLVAALAARAALHDGWPSAIVGPEAGTLSDFDVHGVVDGQESTAFATERLVSVEAARKHARRGLFAFTSVPNRDTVVCTGAPTLAAAASSGAPTLCDQLFAARVAAIVAQIGEAIPRESEPRAAEEVAAVALAEVFPRHGAVPMVEARVKDQVLVVTVAPRRFAGTSAGELTFEAPLAG